MLDVLIARDLEPGIRITDPPLQFGCRSHGPAGNHHVAHPVQFVDAVLEKFFHTLARSHTAFVNRYEQGFEFVAEVAHGLDAGHAGAALERMQVPLEFLYRLPCALVLHPEAERLVGRFEEFR